MNVFSKRAHVPSVFFLLGVLSIINCAFGGDNEEEAKRSIVGSVVYSSAEMLDEKPVIVKSVACSFVRYEKIGDPARVEFLEDCLFSLSKNPVGNKLIQQIEARSGGKTIVFREGSGGHAFCPPRIGSPEGSPLFVDINFTKSNPGSPFSCIGCLGPAAKEVGSTTVFEVGSMIYPFHITLGHELIHLLHYLEDAGAYLERKAIFDASLWPDIFKGRQDITRGDVLWQNLEEQNTVIGGQTSSLELDGEVSEGGLLLAERIAPRYAYHQHDDFFYERPELVMSFFYGRMRNLDRHWSSLTRDRWQFDSAKALTSRLNPDSFKEAHRSDYERVLVASEAGLVALGGDLRGTLPPELKERLERRKALLESKKGQKPKDEGK